MENLTGGLGLSTILENYGYAHVSSGTLNTLDLAEAMYSSVMAYAEPGQELDKWSARILAIMPEEAWQDRNHPAWNTEYAAYLLEELMDSLELIAPEGYYFGSAEGDAAEYAIWAIPPEDAE